MKIRNSFALTLVAASGVLFGCREPRSVEPAAGAIEVVVRSPSDARTLGTLSVRRAEDSKIWRLPLRGEGYHEQRLLLAPGLYALDVEADISAALADPSSEIGPTTASLDLPRWVVVAPAQVTRVNVSGRAHSSAPVALAAAGAPGSSCVGGVCGAQIR